MASPLRRDGLSTRWCLPARHASLRPSESEEDLMTGSIVCGVDDSESAKAAARVARGLSAQLGARLLFVCALDDGSSDGEMSAVAARLHSLAERVLAVAEKEAANLIVVGSTGPRSSLIGSIWAEVSRRAPCPVVVVAPAAELSLTNGNGNARIGGRAG